MLFHKSSLLLSVLVLLLVPKAFAQDWQCFHPDSTPVTNTDYQPCPNQSGLASMCCATNRAVFPDHCQDNGLCLVASPNSAGTDTSPELWRESCSDSSWQSPFCLKLCITGTGPGGDSNQVEPYASNDVLITQCVDGSFCCGQNNTNCCNAGQGTQIASIIGISPTPTSSTTSSTMSTATSTATSSSTSLSTSSSTSSATFSPPPLPSSSSSLSTGAKIGMGVGIAIAVPFAIISAVGVFIRCRKSSRNKKLGIESVPTYELAPKKNPALFEADSSQLANELLAGKTGVAHELGSSNENQPPNELEARSEDMR